MSEWKPTTPLDFDAPLTRCSSCLFITIPPQPLRIAPGEFLYNDPVVQQFIRMIGPILRAERSPTLLWFTYTGWSEGACEAVAPFVRAAREGYRCNAIVEVWPPHPEWKLRWLGGVGADLLVFREDAPQQAPVLLELHTRLQATPEEHRLMQDFSTSKEELVAAIDRITNGTRPPYDPVVGTTATQQSLCDNFRRLDLHKRHKADAFDSSAYAPADPHVANNRG